MAAVELSVNLFVPPALFNPHCSHFNLSAIFLALPKRLLILDASLCLSPFPQLDFMGFENALFDVLPHCTVRRELTH